MHSPRSHPAPLATLVHSTHLFVLGVKQGKRIRHMQQAAQKFAPHLSLHVIDYAAICNHPQHFVDALQPNSWLKIDSPGEDPDVQDFFIRLGLQHQTDERYSLNHSSLQYGQLMPSNAWYAGYASFLKTLEKLIPQELNIRWFNSISSILHMTDKWACQRHLQENHIPTPPLLGRICSYDEFRQLMQAHSVQQVFIKTRYGSSASGIIAYRHTTNRNQGIRQQARSTTVFENGIPFNSKKVCCYTKEKDIAELINTIAQHDAYVETWIPKPALKTIDQTSEFKQKLPLFFDFRTLVLGGQAQHEIVRASAQPMTNLHLDSQRILPEQLQTSSDHVLRHHTLEKAASSFKGAHLIGFDTITNRNKTWVLEANAFGDLLLDVEHCGQTPYEAQLALMLNLEEKNTNSS